MEGQEIWVLKEKGKVVYIGYKMGGSYIFLESTLKSRFAIRGRDLCLRVMLLLFLEFVPVFPGDTWHYPTWHVLLMLYLCMVHCWNFGNNRTY